jgi:predicted KAP-like P-loop ATPase
MDGDRPIKSKEQDRLGFGPFAKHLAQVIVDQAAQDGLVFGLEGKWGAGKSTLVNLTIDALRRNAATMPEIIEFSPWLVGARDELLHHLFDELAAAASRIDPIKSDASTEPQTRLEIVYRVLFGNHYYQLRHKERLKKGLGAKLRAFGAVAGGLSKLVKASGSVGVPFADAASNVIENVGETAKGVFSSTSLTRRKSEIVEALRLLSRRIVIFVDDLDRLPPSEASEVLRLIRAVADFPNVIYVLSYDTNVVAKTLAGC